MEKSELQEWEDKCIQEEPPPCVTGCPIHVDVRSFTRQVGQGGWEEALKTLARTMPFPRILGRICDHPCEATCRRGEAGETIAISSLERVCVETAREKVRGVMLPRKQTRIAVIGSGLASLTAAWDLLRKGYQVTILEPTGRLGGNLWSYPASLLPPEVLTRELQLLEEIGATIELQSDISGSSRIATLRREFDALFVGLDTVGVNCNGLERDDKGSVWCNPLTKATSEAGVFAGGNSIRNGSPSPIYDVLDGRKAATSIDRYTMNLNQENGRELEGPYPSRLYTDTSGIDPLPRVPAAASAGYTADEAVAEAGRCIQCECLECVKVCLYLDRNNGYPKKYARQVFNSEYVMHGRAHTKNLFVNSCSSCGLCETVCPNNFHVGEMMLKERRTFLRKNFMPPSFHEFALLDMEQSRSERCALSRHEPGKTTSSWLYFPSCQLSATTPLEVESSYAYLREKLEGGVGIMLGCCGAPAHWAGRDDLFQEARAAIRSEWERMGRPTVITACSTCRGLFQEQQPEMETRTLWDLVGEHGLPPGHLRHQTTVSISDPCMARHDAATHRRVRELARSLGFAINELPLSAEKAECCGFGGLMFNADPALAKDVIRHRVTAVDPPDTTSYRPTVADNDYLAYCAMCRDNLAGGGKRVSHLIEQLFPARGMDDPASRGWISWTERRHNRALLRERILNLHGEKGAAVSEEEGDAVRLIMSEEVRRTADDRRILESDIRTVIHHAEESGRYLRHDTSGLRRGYHKIGNVTFWVEYAVLDDGYRAHNAYCHRMNIVGALK